MPSFVGRLWIHAASKVPEEDTIKAMEDFYREIYAMNGITNLKFPEHYPVSRLIGISINGINNGSLKYCTHKDTSQRHIFFYCELRSNSEHFYLNIFFPTSELKGIWRFPHTKSVCHKDHLK